MNDSVRSFLAAHEILSGALIVAIALTSRVAHRKLRGAIWYLICLPGVALWAFATDSYPFLFAFLLGFATAFAELVTKFSDEPLKAIGTGQAFAYHLINGLISVLALWILEINGAKVDTPIATAQAVATAGLGSMLILRSKLFNFKVNDKEVSFGPEQLVKVFFSYMESAIDRVRSRRRVEFVKDVMDNVSFNGVYEYTCAMLDASQTLDKDAKKALLDKIDDLKKDSTEQQIKSYQLGFLIMNTMGEDFVSELYANKNDITAWQISAPQETASALPKFLTKDRTIAYFSYGTNMLEEELRHKLGWTVRSTDGIFETAQTAVLKDYALIFNTLTDTRGIGTSNVVPSPGAQVEGVVYRLQPNVAKFLDAVEPGYTMRDCTVLIGDKEESAKLFVAAKTAPDLKPSRQYLNTLIGGAQRRKLSQSYIDTLLKIPTADVALSTTAG